VEKEESEMKRKVSKKKGD